jgi:hypothetical protein
MCKNSRKNHVSTTSSSLSMTGGTFARLEHTSLERYLVTRAQRPLFG